MLRPIFDGYTGKMEEGSFVGYRGGSGFFLYIGSFGGVFGGSGKYSH